MDLCQYVTYFNRYLYESGLASGADIGFSNWYKHIVYLRPIELTRPVASLILIQLRINHMIRDLLQNAPLPHLIFIAFSVALY
jgi:hypothetical protein